MCVCVTLEGKGADSEKQQKRERKIRGDSNAQRNGWKESKTMIQTTEVVRGIPTGVIEGKEMVVVVIRRDTTNEGGRYR